MENLLMDQQRDYTQKTLYNILQERPGIEPLIKHASVGVSLDNLPSSAFADTYNRAYPIDTAANTAMSLAYAIKTADLAPHVSSNLARAAEIYGVILPPKAQVKVAHEEPRYLLPKQKKFGIKTASDVPKAEAALRRVSSKLSTEDLATAATVLVKAAADSEQNVSPVVMQWAGLAQCDLEKAAEWIEAREDSLSGKANGVFAKVASVVRAFDSENTREDLVKIAETVGKLDEVYGLQVHYNRKLPNPMETVFNTKTSMEKMVSLAGTDVPLADLMKKDPEFYGDVLGDDILPEITTDGKLDETKLVEELPILPADMLKLLVSKMGYQVKEAAPLLDDTLQRIQENPQMFPEQQDLGSYEEALSDLGQYEPIFRRENDELMGVLGGGGLGLATTAFGADKAKILEHTLPNYAALAATPEGAEALKNLAPTLRQRLGYSLGKGKGLFGLLAGGALGYGAVKGLQETKMFKDRDARLEAKRSATARANKLLSDMNMARVVERAQAKQRLSEATQGAGLQAELNYLRGLSDLNPTEYVSNPVQYQQFNPLDSVEADRATFDERQRQAQIMGGSQ